MATYTSNYGWTKPEGGDPVNIGTLNSNLDNQDTLLHTIFLQYADVFSTSETYPVGAVVLYSNALYKCHTKITTAGAWSGNANWDPVTVGDLDMRGGGSVLKGTLTAGQTSLTITDASITADSFVDIYTDVYGVSPTAVSVIVGSITLTFTAQSSDLHVAVRITA